MLCCRKGSAAAVAGDLDEKQPAKRCLSWSAIVLLALRIAQWSSAGFILVSSFLLHRWIPVPPLDDDSQELTVHGRMRILQTWSFASFAYYSFILGCYKHFLGTAVGEWRGLYRFAAFSWTADLLGLVPLVLAPVWVRSVWKSGQCSATARATVFESYSNFRFNTTQQEPHGLYLLCHLTDLGLYLSALTAASQTITAVLTLFRARSALKRPFTPVSLEEGLPSRRSSLAPDQRPASPRPSTDEKQQLDSAPAATNAPTEVPSFQGVLSGHTWGRRASVSTTSTAPSVNPETYLVSDGWRAPEEPPLYSSRPPSLQSRRCSQDKDTPPSPTASTLPEYSSRPASLRQAGRRARSSSPSISSLPPYSSRPPSVRRQSAEVVEEEGQGEAVVSCGVYWVPNGRE